MFGESSAEGSFRKKYAFGKRAVESERIREKYPQRVPVIVESNDFEVEKRKYLVPNDLTVGQFSYVIRKRIKLPATEALFLILDNPRRNKKKCIMAPTSKTLQEIYGNHKDPDGFLYMFVRKDNVFGA